MGTEAVLTGPTSYILSKYKKVSNIVDFFFFFFFFFFFGNFGKNRYITLVFSF